MSESPRHYIAFAQEAALPLAAGAQNASYIARDAWFFCYDDRSHVRFLRDIGTACSPILFALNCISTTVLAPLSCERDRGKLHRDARPLPRGLNDGCGLRYKYTGPLE